ncbi:hypothetical protein D3C72_1659890 [compost metagenome]
MLAVAASSVPSPKVYLVGQLSKSAAEAKAGSAARERASKVGIGRMMVRLSQIACGQDNNGRNGRNFRNDAPGRSGRATGIPAISGAAPV